MLYVVYIDEQRFTPTLLGAFLMKTDAQYFLDNHYLKDTLVLQEVDQGWQHWQDIINKIKGCTL